MTKPTPKQPSTTPPPPARALQSDRRTPAPGGASTPSLFHEHPAHPRAANQPVHKIRHGAISASIWRQDTEKGPMYNVTFQRSYRDGENWKTSTSFGRNNLLVLSLIAARAFEWIDAQTHAPEQ